MKLTKFAAMFFGILILVGCGTDPEIDNSYPLPEVGDSGSGLLQETEASGSDWYRVYFTEPDSPASSTLRGGPDAHLAEAIHKGAPERGHRHAQPGFVEPAGCPAGCPPPGNCS
ncbi:MAG: hypothetical protein WBG94_20135 [Anaerolineales bacterium]